MKITSGRSNTCGLQTNGFVVCWGKNDSGQSSPPKEEQFVQISAGHDRHVCGITLNERDVQCWGHNSRGQSNFKKGTLLHIYICCIHHYFFE